MLKMIMPLSFLVSLFLLSPVPARSLNPPLNDDIVGLMLFKADVRDPKRKLESWNEDDENPCQWPGIKCHPRTNRVIELKLDGFCLTGRMGRGLLQLEFLHVLSLPNNNLTGTINPQLLLNLKSLKVLDLSGNALSGSIPEDFFKQCMSLKVVSLANNGFSGRIPGSISSCLYLAALNFSSNLFSGALPSGIWNLTALRTVDLSGNSLEGEIPKAIDDMKSLRELDLSRNNFSGLVPDGIGSCLLLKSLDFSENSLSGSLPDGFQKLSQCNNLNLRNNALEGEIPKSFGNMSSLETLDLSSNKFSGYLPSSLGSLVSLKAINVSSNAINGSIPDSMANCENLSTLDFSRNSISGGLPEWIFQLSSHNFSVMKTEEKTVGRFQNLQVFDVSCNSFSGLIGPGVGELSQLKLLNLSRNSLSGSIPASIGDLKHLDALDLSYNKINGSIPQEVGRAVSLQELRLENNLLVGKLPSSIGSCSSLKSLVVSRNKLSGPLPFEVGKLTKLQNVDLSFNDLSGTLPKQLANLPNLYNFNISNNHLQGELPSGGFFNTISPFSVSGNPALCGAVVNKSCPAVLPKPIVLDPNSTFDPETGPISPKAGHKRIILSISSLIAIGAAGTIVIGVIAITVLNLRVRVVESQSAAPLAFSGGDEFSPSPTTDANSGKLVMFSGEPDLNAGTHALLNKDCELARGGFGAVYRTMLRDGCPVAIKKLTVSSLVKSQVDFEREAKMLGKIKHPNLVSLEGYYWTPSLQLLIYEFVPGGSLYKHLHESSGGSSLLWNERFNLILGTARSLAYLHQSNIIHYNIKSSNILLDSSGEPKVGDYGLARLLPMLDRYVLSSKIQSALGYMAPEFACRTVKITEKCDVYGFGVLVLEIVTGKRPVEYMEDDVVVLCDMVRGALDEGRIEACVDERLQGKFPAEEAAPVIKLGLICTSQVPSSRPDMQEVVKILEMIRSPLVSTEDSGSS